MLATGGKWAAILVVADVITALVLGKGALGILKGGGDEGGEGGEKKNWKDKIADQVMADMKAKEAAKIASDAPQPGASKSKEADADEK